MGRIGRSIALGQGFANPYGDSTGPTAWEPPLYPFLIGGVFRVFGIYSPASAWVLLTINSLFTALTSIPIFLIAREMIGRETGPGLGLDLGATCPMPCTGRSTGSGTRRFRRSCSPACFCVALELEHAGGWKSLGAFRRALGLARRFPTPPCCPFSRSAGSGCGFGGTGAGCASLAGVGLAAMIFFLCLAPWLVRNARVFGHFVFVRDDFGLQFRLGNGPHADGMLMPYLQPNLNPAGVCRSSASWGNWPTRSAAGVSPGDGFRNIPAASRSSA